ncbi:MAG: HAMP domain-containing protein [Candidatus Lambdaproteobacteria bacterium]|nr:HAMP domain-containing protein [Candidatus Lambdaproteobacteria bacterium]
MKSFFSSLYVRISVIFLLLLVVYGIAQLILGVRSARDFAQESDQSLNHDLARDLVGAFQPGLRQGLNKGAIEARIHDMMIYNPRVEIYLLDTEGQVLAYFSEARELARTRVNMAPVRAFLDRHSTPPMPIMGDDPRNAGKQKPFSVARIMIGDAPGYLYLILGGEQYESIAAMLEQSFIIRNSAISLVAMFLFFALCGLLLFFLLTKRLRAMAGMVRAFERGDHALRLPEAPRDEIGQLGRAFNEMAGQVISHVAQIERSEHLRRELLANVSHDLRSPLASIQAHLESLLMEGYKQDADKRERFLTIIHDNVKRLGALIDELFELSKLEARQVAPHLEPFALPELVQDVLLKFQPMAMERHVRLGGDYPAGLPTVRGDIGMIERVLSNLIDNALRYTPRDGQVRVLLAAEGPRVRIAVSDSGSGIAAEDLPHVFDRFYRADKSRSRFSGGSGLGLAIAKSIVESHGGELQVQSALSRGSTFSFALPTHRPAGREGEVYE